MKARGNIVTVVDAETGLDTLAAHEESRRQAAIADRLVVTKTDLDTEGRFDALERRLRRLNPSSPVIRAADGALAPERLLARDVDDADGRRSSRYDCVVVSWGNGMVVPSSASCTCRSMSTHRCRLKSACCGAVAVKKETAR